MKSLQISSLICAIFLSLTISGANAGTPPADMEFPAAIKYSLDLLDKSPYKTLEISTTSGSFSGDFVSRTKGVIVLKGKTGSIHMKSGKEKLLMSYIDISTITAISIYVLDK
ncbi:hypothetical protein MNBD_GAMMA09-2949 [hydrothermal vent metagenome]|uniref:Uncharacterized protein n=1 Tax=hydrothermal vent metagenome TaxID=652676 RepID=A0A3B0XAP0_9ZZZZ